MYAQSSSPDESAGYRRFAMNLKGRFIAKLGELGATTDHQFLVGVSGGLDSTVLLHMCKYTGLNIQAVHVNYGLRGAESDADEHFVRETCRDLEITCHVEKMQIDKSAAKDGIQDLARNFRYALFDELRKKHEMHWTLTAHHLDDRLETMLMNMARGAGLKGLKSIPEKNGAILRPFLDISREELLHFAKAEGITWREDSSNATDAYLRNRVRHGAAAEFKSIAPHALANAGKSMAFLAEVDDYMKISAEAIIETNLRPIAAGELRMNINAVEAMFRYPALVKYIMEMLGFDPAQLPALQALGEGQTGKKLIGTRYTVYRDRDYFAFSDNYYNPLPTASITNEEGWITNPISLRWSIIDTMHIKGLNMNKEVAQLDAGLTTLPFELRLWQEGDRFKPFGMEGTRKVSDFLTDLKLSPVEKERTYVLLSQGEICWVVGHRISDRFRVRPNTGKMWRFELIIQPFAHFIVNRPHEQ
jgi:tRNA(Ile)-lysidine synthase